MSSTNMDTFIFYKGWFDAVEGFGKDFGEDYARELIYNLACYVFKGKFRTKQQSVKSWVLSCMPIIESAKERYEVCQENGKLGGRPTALTESDKAEIVQLRAEGKTIKELAEIYNCSTDTIARAMKNAKPQNLPDRKTAKPQNHNVNVNDNVNVNANVKENVNENVKANNNANTHSQGESMRGDEKVVTSADGVGENSIQAKEKIKVDRFTPPTVDEIRAYCEERNNKIDPECFWDFYTSKGWMVGKNRMKDWRACVRSWEKSRAERAEQNSTAKDMDDPMATYNIFAQLYDEEYGYKKGK